MLKVWELSLSLMRKGSKAIITCPPEYAYGSTGKYENEEEIVPPDAFMTFKVELIEF